MPRIMITCPKTGKPIHVINVAKRSKFETGMFTNMRIECPECGQMHTWNKSDAYLEGDSPSPGGSSGSGPGSKRDQLLSSVSPPKPAGRRSRS